MQVSLVFCKVAFTVPQMLRMREIADFLSFQKGAALNRSASADGIEINPRAIEKVIETACNTMWQFSQDVKDGKTLGVVDSSVKKPFDLAAKPATYKQRDITSFVSLHGIDDLWQFPMKKGEETFDFPVTVKSKAEYDHALELKKQIKKSIGMETDQEFFLKSVGLLDLIIDHSLNGVVFVRKNRSFLSRQFTPVRFDFIPS